jgi:hypothetical protein
MVLYPSEMPMSFNQFSYASEDILVAGQRDAESRSRRRITRQQAAILENAFNENAKPNRNVRQELAQVLAISPRNVQVCHPLSSRHLIVGLVPKPPSKSQNVEEECRATHSRSPGGGNQTN